MKLKKAFSILLALCMALSLLPTAALADDSITVGYIDEYGEPTTASVTPLTGSETELSAGWYAVTEDVTDANRISIRGDVDLILCDGATLTVPEGVSVNSGNSLTVWGQSAGTGTLNVYNSGVDDNFAGIGGDNGCSSGTITINGGTVKARGGDDAAGIGGGYGGSGTVVINGGTVTARNRSNAAGIGGGYNGIGIVVINGGTVTAVGGSYAAGIGGGRSFSTSGGTSRITISGGTVSATGNYGGASIGGGRNCTATVVISGGNVTANYAMNSFAIGDGENAFGSAITLSWTDETKAGMSVQAYSYGGTVTLEKPFEVGSTIYRAGSYPNSSAFNNVTLRPHVTHRFADPTWEWSGYSSAELVFTCGCGETDRQAAAISSEPGNHCTIYTATVTVDGTTYTDTKTKYDSSEVSYRDPDGTDKTVTAEYITSDRNDLESGWYALLDNVTNEDRISVTGDVNIILGSGATLTAPKGIEVADSGSLTIWAQSGGNGRLLIDNVDSGMPAIGNSSGNGCTVTINGGSVTAAGGTGIEAGDGNILLNWTNSTDSITADSYSGTVTLQKGFTDGTRRYVAGTLSDVTGLAGKTLTPLYCTITYTHGILGSGADITEQIGQGASTVLPECGFTAPTGYEFYGWYVTVGGEMPVTLQPGDTVTVTEDTEIEAVWALSISSWAELQAAINNAADGDVIALGASLKAGASDTALEVSGNKSITIDLHGHFLDRGRSSSDADGHVLIVRSGSTLTLTDTVGGVDYGIKGGWATNGGGINNQGTLIVDGVSFYNNRADNGGAIMNYNTLEVRDCLFYQNTFTGKGGAICSIPNASLGVTPTATIVDSRFARCSERASGTDTSKGGAIYNAGTLTMSGGTVQLCTADAAGAIYNDQNAELTLTNVELTDNESLSQGGGAIMNCGTAMLTDCTAEANTAANGGAICNRGALIVTGGAFNENTITGGGGAIWSDGTATITGAVFSGNTGAINGGAIASHGSMTLNDCRILNNSASAAGGAIFTGNNGNESQYAPLTVNGGVISENSAPLGGGIYIDSETVNLNSAAVTQNTASDRGGGVFVNGSGAISQGVLNADHASISSNTAGDGGGIYIAQYLESYAFSDMLFKGTADLRDTVVSENTTTEHGGGGITNYGAMTLTDCQIKDNTAAGRGGGIYNANELTMTGTTVSGNTTSTEGGGICAMEAASASKTTVTDSVISDNTAADGGGIFICDGAGEKEKARVTISGVSAITGNEATVHGGGGIRNGDRLALSGDVTVTGNTCVGGGSGIWNNGIMEIQDKIVVKENSSTDEPLMNNVYLKSGRVMTLTGKLTDGTCIGVTSGETNVALTSGYGIWHNGDDPEEIFFTSEGRVLRAVNGEVRARVVAAVDYYDPISGTMKTNTECVVVDSGMTAWDNDWYAVTESVKIDSRVLLSGNVNLILCNGANLIVPKGISVPENADFTVWGQIEEYVVGEDYQLAGHLYTFSEETNAVITPDYYCAGIGGDYNSSTGIGTRCGNITVNGGRITAFGGNYAPGIGTTRDADGNRTITVNNGLIVSYGGPTNDDDNLGRSAAGIGGGYWCTSPRITINGGGIYAQGSGSAAGIGGGWQGYYWPITITGGEVYAYGATCAAGIGLGTFESHSSGVVASKVGGGLIDIQGGKVIAMSLSRNDSTYTSLLDPTQIKTGAGAFVYGDHAEDFNFYGSVRLYEGAKTTYTRNYVPESEGGPEPSVVFSRGNNFTSEDLTDRVWILQNSYTVTIEPCDHAGATYSQNIIAPQTGHVMHCTTCNLPETIEPHIYDSTGKCTLCGYQTEIKTVTFDSNGGSDVEAQTVFVGEKAAKPDDPTREGYIFIGWQLNGVDYDFNTLVTSDITLTAAWEEIVPKFRTKSLVLSGQIGVNFFMELPQIEGVDYSTSYMTFDITGNGTTTPRDDFDPDDMNTSGTFYGFTCYVNSLQMADTITAKFHYMKNGEEKIVELEYSVKEYLTTVENNADQFNEKTLTLIKAIADYGHYAQIFLAEFNELDIGTDYAEMDKFYTTEFDYEAVKAAVSDKGIVKTLGDSDIEKVTYNLYLNSDTTLEIHLKPKNDAVVTAKAVFNGRTYIAKLSEDGRYAIHIDGISAHLLGETITINGTAGSEFTIQVSALSYVKAVMNSSSFGTDAKNAMCALYNYYDAVMKYRGN